ncbi:MAG: hypothetical protein V1911_04295 [Candidatus Micrarchaeota archaeon]
MPRKHWGAASTDDEVQGELEKMEARALKKQPKTLKVDLSKIIPRKDHSRDPYSDAALEEVMYKSIELEKDLKEARTLLFAILIMLMAFMGVAVGVLIRYLLP